MARQLDEIVTELEQARHQAGALLATTPEAAFTRRPAPGHWSVAECLDHLNLTTLIFLPLLDAALAEARQLPPAGARRFRRDFTGWLLCTMSEPPIRHRVATTALFTPAQVGSRDEVHAAYQRLQEELIERVRRSDGLALDRVTIISPFNARIRYHAYSCFRVLAAHQRRHLWQAEQVQRRLRTA